jgi:hypothetical protein
MTEGKNNQSIVPSKADAGFIKNLTRQVRLVLRLIADKRVNLFIKVLPIGSLIYLIAPDIFPLNPLDDAAIIGVGFYMFMELCPPEVVEEHRQAIWGQGQAQDTQETVEASFKDNGDE